MICGVELFIEVSEEKAIWLCSKFNLCVKNHFSSKQERLIHEKKNSFLRDGTYKHFQIEVRRSGGIYSLTIRGSIHKFFHGNNKGFFAGHDILKAKLELIKTFDVDPGRLQILNIEIGSNIPVWFLDVFGYLKSNLLYHKKKMPVEIPKTSKVGYMFKHEDYLLKFYQKAKNLLRFEVKLTSIKMLEKHKVRFLSDLNEDNINSLTFECLLKEFQFVTMADGLNIYYKEHRNDSLTSDDRESLLEFTSHLFVSSYNETLKEATKDKKDAMRQKSYRLKKKCLNLIQLYGNGDHEKIFDLIYNQVEEFINSWHSEDIKSTNVTISAIIKEGENVTQSINNIITLEDYTIPIKNMNNTKSKKQVLKEKIIKDKKVTADFHSLLTITLRKIEQGAA